MQQTSHTCNRRACVECAMVAARGQHSDFNARTCLEQPEKETQEAGLI